MVTIPLPLDYQQHKIDDMVDNSVVPLHHPAASEQAVRYNNYVNLILAVL